MSLLTLLTIVHLTFAVLLIIFVLLQDSKGGAIGFMGGGVSSNTVFGTGGAATFLVKATRWLAILFAGTCITLAYLSTNSGDSVTDKLTPGEATSTTEGVAPPTEGEVAPEENSPEKNESNKPHTQ